MNQRMASYGSYESYVAFSSDLIHWSPPQYTSLPVNESKNYAFHEKMLLELDGTKIKAINLKDLETDSDNDGLKDLEEEVLLTNANNPDTDGDGIDDLMDFRVLFFNPAEFKRYVDRFSEEKKDFLRICFDKIEFSPDKGSVEVEFSYFPTSFTGDGHRMRLRKVNNEWVVVSREQTWIS